MNVSRVPRVAPQLLRLEEVAERLGISRDSVERLIAARELTVVDIRAGGKRPRPRVSEADLAAFISKRTLTPASRTPRRPAS